MSRTKGLQVRRCHERQGEAITLNPTGYSKYYLLVARKRESRRIKATVNLQYQAVYSVTPLLVVTLTGPHHNDHMERGYRTERTSLKFAACAALK